MCHYPVPQFGVGRNAARRRKEYRMAKIEKLSIQDQAKAWVFQLMYDNRNLTVDDVFGALRELVGQAEEAVSVPPPTSQTAKKKEVKKAAKKKGTKNEGKALGGTKSSAGQWNEVRCLRSEGVPVKNLKDLMDWRIAKAAGDVMIAVTEARREAARARAEAREITRNRELVGQPTKTGGNVISITTPTTPKVIRRRRMA